MLLKKPEIILSDEPSAALDDSNTQMVINVLRECSNNGAIVIISTHDKRVTDQCDIRFNLTDERAGSISDIV
jgi:putative ABC transport system ATP-binding protein